MKRSSVGLLSLALGTGILAAGGCSPDGVSPMAPAPAAPSASLNSSTVGLIGVVQQLFALVPVVTRTQLLTRNETVTQTIGPAGGTIILPTSKTTITFAPGAVDKATSISATAYAGFFVAYGFAPHGITFKAPVTLTTDLTNTTAYLHPEWSSTMSGGYTPNGTSDINTSVGSAQITEQNIAQGKVGSGGKTLVTASFNIPHFSGYILASGRSAPKTTATK